MIPLVQLIKFEIVRKLFILIKHNIRERKPFASRHSQFKKRIFLIKFKSNSILIFPVSSLNLCLRQFAHHVQLSREYIKYSSWPYTSKRVECCLSKLSLSIPICSIFRRMRFECKSRKRQKKVQNAKELKKKPIASSSG